MQAAARRYFDRNLWELELPELGCQIRQAAQRHDFRPERITLEVEGVCVGCRTDTATVAHA